MLFRHSFYYLLGRGLPGLLNFAAIAAYTRLLTPAEFGRYAFVLTWIGLANVTLFQWQRLVVARNLMSRRGDQARFLSENLWIFGVLSGAVLLAGGAGALITPDSDGRKLILLATLLLITQGGFELVLAVARAAMRPGLFGWLLGGKAVLALVVGTAFALAGRGAEAPILGLLTAQAMVLSMTLWRNRGRLRPVRPGGEDLRAALRYGVPLTAAFALGWIISGSDRVLIAWLLGDGEAGLYAAGYDIAFNGVTLALVIVNTAAYPLVVGALEKQGLEGARRMLTLNGEAILSLAFALAAVLLVLGDDLVSVLLGEEFRDGARAIFPWLAVATAVAGIKSFHFDFAFQLARSTHWQILSVTIAVVLNIALNLALIPRMGITGAAIATLAAHGAAAAVSALTGRAQFPMPLLPRMLCRAAVAASGAAAGSVAGAAAGGTPVLSLLLGGMAAAVCFLVTAFALDLCECRQGLAHRIPQRSASRFSSRRWRVAGPSGPWSRSPTVLSDGATGSTCSSPGGTGRAATTSIPPFP